MNLRLFFERRDDLSRDEKIDMVCHYVDNLEKQNNLMYNTLSDIAADKRAPYAHPEWGDIGDRARCVLGWVYRIGLTNPVFAKITYQDGKIYMEGPVQAVEEATTRKQNTQPVENEYWQKDPKKRANYDKFVQAHTAANLVDKAPEMFVGTKEDAKRLLNWQGDRAIVKTPIEEINIVEQNMEHLFDENERERRGFLLYAIKTMQNPNLIVESGKKRVYIKLFNTGTETKPHWQIVKAANDGTFYVTNYRPTRNQVEKEIKYGQVVYNLANVQNKGVPLSDNFIITQSDSDVNTQSVENSIYNQGNSADNVVDLTASFEKNPSIDDVKDFLDKVVKAGSSYATLSPDWLIDVKGGRKRKQHIAYSDIWNDMTHQEKKRHNKYVMAFEQIINNSIYSHTTKNKKLDLKPNIEKYHYFTSRVKIGDKIYDIVLDTEQYKGESEKKPQTVHLYNIKEVSPSNSKTAIKSKRETPRDNISQNGTDVNPILYQSAFAGSRVDYEHPSLEAIGTGEGAQVHGWGLYYALSKDVAERYREDFDRDNYFFNEDKLEAERKKQEKSGNFSKTELLEDLLIHHDESNLDNFSDEIVDWYKKEIRPNVLNKNYRKTQVHEVDVPENPYLLDEQLSFNKQSDFVKEALRNLNNAEDLGLFEKEGLIIRSESTGGEIYQTIGKLISSKIGRDEKTSKLLEKYGIKGITYEDGQDGRCFVIFNPDDVKVIQKFYQNEKNPNGAYHPADKAIEITKRANASTLPHEMAHYWLDNIFAYVKSGLASPDYIKSWNNAAAWMGVNPAQNFLRRSQHEKFARGYEKYLLTKMVPFDDEGVPIFKRYGQWLRQVYDRANSLGVRLTEDALRFFNEWTSGKLPAPTMPPLPMKDEAFIQKEEQVVAKVADAVLSRMDEQAQMANTALDTDQVRVEQTRSVPRITAGEERASRVYSREMEKISERLAEDTLAQHEITYHKVSLAEQAERAAAFVRDNISMAKDIVDGKMPPPEGLLETPVLIAYEQEMLRQGEYNEYVRALETHSRLATIRGQEISSERLAEQSPTTVEWWLNRALANMKTQAERIIHKRTRQSYNEFVDDQIAKVMRRLNMATSTTQAADIITAWAQNVAKTLNMQSPTDLPPPTLWQTEQAQKIGLRAILDHLLGVQITPEIAERVNAQISEIADGFEMTLDKTGNPSIQSLKQFDKLNRYIEGLTPSSMVAIMASTVQRSLMLASIKSPIVNIVSNAEMLMTEAFVNRIAGVLTRQSGVGSLVDRKVVRDYLSYAEKAYRAAAVNVSTTRKLDFQKVIKGERIVTTAGSDKFRRAAHLLETGVFKYLMGYPDSISKDLAFVDYVQARATKEAERAKVKDVRRAATDIFKDACLLEPRTEIGQKIREEGQIVANKTTFTDNSALAQASVKVRDAFNIATGDWRIGDQIAPFVKTPANVSQVTLEYALGSLWTVFKAKQIISDIRAGELSAVSRRAIEAGVRNGLGVALAMLIASAIDDDDYIPPLFMITDPGTRQQLLDAGSVFNAIRVGDHFVSLDF